ncbi:MAG TPA: hypothetical protein VE623_04490 [Acidimicrobiales bacterium]|nr:hypothetical protein [Acidimicrobiales bacterium]
MARTRTSFVDRGLRLVQTRGMSRGVMGGSGPWFWVFLAAWGARRLRRAIGSEPVVVYRGEVKPGHTMEIRHLLETYDGKRVRRR